MDNLSIFDCNKTPLKIDKPIRLIELFAGVGSQAKSLKRLGANFEHYRISEWEVNAAASYKAIHKENDNTDYSAKFTKEELTEILFNIGISTDGKKPLTKKEIARKNEQWQRTVYNNFKATNNVGSILNIKGADLGVVDTDKYSYILSYSFPCQDLSLAGKGNGMAKGSGTRSGLLWEVERLLNECTELPQILLMENVTQVHGSKNKEHFEEWIRFLESKGYSNYWKDLNAKNFGIPQNRNRTFMVSVLGDYIYEFPKEFPLELRLKDLLEPEVDEKFYLSNVQMSKILNWNAQQKPLERVLGRESIVQTITARGAGENHSGMIVYSPENENTTNMQSTVKELTKIANGDISRTVRAGGRGSVDRHSWDIVAEQIDPFICASRGRNPENPSDRRAGIPTEQRLEANFSGCANTLTTVQKDNYVAEPQIVQIPHGYMKGNVQEISPSITTSSWESNNLLVEPFIHKIDIPQTVRVRKYDVDCVGLCKLLRDHKTSSGLKNQEIADNLNVPLTKVNHWFRQDKFFAIPDADIWFKLKNLLCIETDEFDESIMTFEEKDGVFEKANRCYLPNGLSPTITSASADEKIVEPLAYDEQNGYIRKDGIVGTLTTDGSSPKHNNRVVEPVVCEQRKDEGLRFFKGDYCGTLRTIDACGDKRVIESNNVPPPPVRIRKLTPKECWRLMGFDDEDFEKAASVNSISQLYKQAGNSIVVDVLYYIFRNMLEV